MELWEVMGPKPRQPLWGWREEDQSKKCHVRIYKILLICMFVVLFICSCVHVCV